MRSERKRTQPALAAIAAGALLLAWPALWNRYPILFSDSGAFLAQTVVPLMIWDKPWIYGPFAWVFHQHRTLWGTVAAQALIVSQLLWLLARATRGATPARHLQLCAGAALFTTLPWSVALIMPDVLTPVAVLATALLAWNWQGLGRFERAWLLLLAPVAVASHLAHLPVAFALLVLALLLRAGRGAAARAAWPLLGALALLLATNLAGHGRLSVSPHGSVFLLARLIADGPAARTIAARCPEAGWTLCAAAGRLPGDSDLFLWHPDSPMNRAPDGQAIMLGGVRLAPEARLILGETLAREPFAVLRGALLNFATQLRRAGVGDTLHPRHLDVTVEPRLAERFPDAERQRMRAARQLAGELEAAGAALGWLYPAVLALAAPFALLAWARLARAGDARRLGLLLALLVGLGANALASGALSGPQPRYQARIAWLLPVAAVLFWRPAPARQGGGLTPATPEAASSSASAAR